ncbi:hypothetical protein [Paraburkholderia dipogonis]|uniref:hypothetical protein n=1 Tax=Paraburkholderia dipogonis TaxID=1211383 RepID=UPI0038B8A63F
MNRPNRLFPVFAIYRLFPVFVEYAFAAGKYKPEGAPRIPPDVEEMITTLTDMTEDVVAEVEALLPAAFPNDVSDRIFEGLRQQSAKLAGQ